MEHPLPPLISPAVNNLLLQEPDEIYKLQDLFGSPLHLVFPQLMQANVRKFRQVLDAAGMQEGKIYFAAKANKAEAFLAAGAAAAAGADVSSLYEFWAALANGVPGEKISVSGPTKPPELLAMAVAHNARVGIDEPSEIGSLVNTVADLGLRRPVRVYLRVASQFGSSRFGMDTAVLTRTMHQIKESGDNIQLDGFSFHVPGYESSDRAEMIGLACEKLLEAAELGLSASRINIGGGLKAAYADPKLWSQERALEREFMGGVKPAKSYPYAAEVTGAAQLEEILKLAKPALDRTAASLGRPVLVDIEPGRSLLEQAGITIFKVLGTHSVAGKQIVVVDGNSRELADSFSNEFLLDPMLITKREVKKDTFAAAIASNTCKEDDFLARRFVPLPFQPVAEDLLVYVNTAGYEMDSKESEFHHLPIPTKVAATRREGAWRFVTDKKFTLVDGLGLPELDQ